MSPEQLERLRKVLQPNHAFDEQTINELRSLVEEKMIQKSLLSYSGFLNGKKFPKYKIPSLSDYPSQRTSQRSASSSQRSASSSQTERPSLGVIWSLNAKGESGPDKMKEDVLEWLYPIEDKEVENIDWGTEKRFSVTPDFIITVFYLDGENGASQKYMLQQITNQIEINLKKFMFNFIFLGVLHGNTSQKINLRTDIRKQIFLTLPFSIAWNKGDGITDNDISYCGKNTFESIKEIINPSILG